MGEWHTDRERWKVFKERVRKMRHEPTPAEALLWQHLRGRQRGEIKFRRQHAIDNFIVDFYSREARLIIEVDGEIHAQTAEYDAFRTETLEAMGFRVLRFTNDEVLNHTARVLQTIDATVETPIPQPLSPHAEKGEQPPSRAS